MGNKTIEQLVKLPESILDGLRDPEIRKRSWEARKHGVIGDSDPSKAYRKKLVGYVPEGKAK